MLLRNVRTTITFAFIALLALSACRAPAITEVPNPTDNLNALFTQVAATLIAQGETSPTPEITNTPLVVTATSSPTTAPPIPAATNTNTPVPATSVPVAVCNQAAFMSDVTIPDGTQMSKGEDFTKTWRLRNTGTCTWDGDYTVVFESGTNMASKTSFKLPKNVAPGENVDISILMEAPDPNGTYKGNWELRSDTGATFGVAGSGGSAGVPFFVLIKVTNGTGGGGGGSGGTYDFAANVCDADWSSGTDNNLPCPGASSGSDGFVRVDQNPDLENHQEDEPAIWMQPNHAANGFIRGEFPKYTVKNGDHFIATIGCLDGYPNCRVTMKLSYIKSNGTEINLGTWDEKYDNLVGNVNIDLSSLAGQEVQFVLTVETGNTSYNHANAFWFVPRID